MAIARALATDPDRVLATAARLFAAQGSVALPAVLALARDALACRDVILRGPDPTSVVARATGSPGLARREAAEVALDIPVRLVGELRGVLTALAERPFTPMAAAVLAGFADLVALVTDRDASGTRAAAARAVLDDEADRAQVAATLFEGVDQALVTVRYAGDLVASGRAGPEAIDEPVRAALRVIRQAYNDLRAHALEVGLREALHEMSARVGGDRIHDGSPALRLDVSADDPLLDLLPPAVAVTVQRVAEAALRGATGRATVLAAYVEEGVKLWVESAEIAYDASELSRWSRRAAALGGDLRLRPNGVELSLPAELSSIPPDEVEGRHDDGSHLRRPPPGT